MSAAEGKYPEADKLVAKRPETEAAGSFFEWLCEHKGLEPYWFDETLEQMLAEWAGIDLAKLEAERRAMLDEHRRQQGISP